MFNVFLPTLMDVILMIAGHGEEEGWECGGILSLTEERVSECCKQDHIEDIMMALVPPARAVRTGNPSGLHVFMELCCAWKVSLGPWTQHTVG